MQEVLTLKMPAGLDERTRSFLLQKVEEANDCTGPEAPWVRRAVIAVVNVFDNAQSAVDRALWEEFMYLCFVIATIHGRPDNLVDISNLKLLETQALNMEHSLSDLVEIEEAISEIGPLRASSLH